DHLPDRVAVGPGGQPGVGVAPRRPRPRRPPRGNEPDARGTGGPEAGGGDEDASLTVPEVRVPGVRVADRTPGDGFLRKGVDAPVTSPGPPPTEPLSSPTRARPFRARRP